ncbi:hypothetical protein B0O99DRAFT_593745 [Bisporella sp. PMI_857]|nr:hypothetical protein B0O99DRAFT_593745 [Bisporella sp. PMI_857]
MKTILPFFFLALAQCQGGWWELRHHHGDHGQGGQVPGIAFSIVDGSSVEISPSDPAPVALAEPVPTAIADQTTSPVPSIQPVTPLSTFSVSSTATPSIAPNAAPRIGPQFPGIDPALIVPAFPVEPTTTLTPTLTSTRIISLKTGTSDPISPLISTCSNPLSCRKSTACSADRKCLCQPSVDGVGYCLADVSCSKLKDCDTNADCGERSKCMVTCCAEKKCLEVQFLCNNPGSPSRIFKNSEDGVGGGEGADRGEKEETTNGVERRRRARRSRRV